MAKKTIQRFLPDPNKIRHHKSLKIFGKLLQDANLWHLNRRSARGAFAVGLFFAFIPVPFQMVLAAATAILFRVNLPISATLVWLTNPLTMPPIFYGSYLVGTLVLNQPEQHFAFELNWAWFEQSIETIGPAFLVGSLVCASIASIIGYFGIDILWRRSVVKARAARK
ncbi:MULTISPECIES: DUF2062 domain-containing protein [Pseudoalteromonas]|jgi:uncharacterized protein (DUF2062 family)|uniref:DUF2062 domain-containing protein n=1 Tax=Pseudoalteromonas marina TaxID=267375 RepID=A0ABT9FCX3_9GAMM|nr:MULTISPECIES: DUF2062 domain-containing protein [Pseudoalteromonas]EAW27788.1 hypothetical protein ATW7_13408 [Alteromonadales bacterium TW-7]MBL1386062.1 DUF2062 domain-containing protein [Colwellia sp.]ATG58331.1 DUF2062 domain-containing protein [Pseudoalteromonas marina]KAF7780396.1 hypothetical protein PMAN_a1414 [Pseudoalteromonas marina]MCK8122530.1 DUF2062 domain-containing protein [Pseudoalteromonas sp. 2CM32C]|tara:strand:+ start:4155 stop:4658 length:504 start_codon:yes stop_codon:yes gene_type:complete